MSTFPTSRRTAAGAFLIALTMAGCSGNSIAPTNSGSSDTSSPSQIRERANGHVVHSNAAPATKRGWISPDAKGSKNLFYWGNFDSNTINIYSSKGVNTQPVGQITTGLNEPERLFVDKQGSVYATDLGNNTVTAYKNGSTSPFLTISDGVNSPTGLTVDAAGTVYVANVGNNTITEYPKGKTSPSVTIAEGAEYLATDSKDNLYASTGLNVDKFAKGSTTGTPLNLTIGGAGALEVDKKGTIIIIDSSTDNMDYFPAGKTAPSKQVPVGGFPFSISLSSNEKQIYISNLIGSAFQIQTLAYPKGTKVKTKNNTNGGDWPIAVSPDAVLGK